MYFRYYSHCLHCLCVRIRGHVAGEVLKLRRWVNPGSDRDFTTTHPNEIPISGPTADLFAVQALQLTDADRLIVGWMALEPHSIEGRQQRVDSSILAIEGNYAVELIVDSLYRSITSWASNAFLSRSEWVCKWGRTHPGAFTQIPVSFRTTPLRSVVAAQMCCRTKL